jgi:hypothetical protein
MPLHIKPYIDICYEADGSEEKPFSCLREMLKYVERNKIIDWYPKYFYNVTNSWIVLV